MNNDSQVIETYEMRLLKEISHLQDTIETMKGGMAIYGNRIKDYEHKLEIADLNYRSMQGRYIELEILYLTDVHTHVCNEKFNNLPWYLRLYHFIKEGMYK